MRHLHRSGSPTSWLIAGLLPAALALPSRAQAPATDPGTATLPPFRVLVVASTGADAEPTGRAIPLLTEAIRTAGFEVVDQSQAARLMARQQATMQALLRERGQGKASATVEGGQDEAALFAQLALASRCDVVLRLDIQRTRQRKQQGRYIIGLRGSFQASFSDSAAGLGSGEATAIGRALDSYDEAETLALASLLVPHADGNLVDRVVAALRNARQLEATKGPKLTIAVFAAEALADTVAQLGDAIGAMDGVAPGSHKALATFPTRAFTGDGAGICHELTIRSRGGIPGIQRQLLQHLRTRAREMEQDSGDLLRPVFLASGRRLEVILRTAPQDVALADEVERVVQDAVATLYRRYGDALAGQRLAVLPATIGADSKEAAQLNAFQRGFRQAYDTAESRLQDAGNSAGDPLTDSGTVQIQGQVYANLAAARDHLFGLEEAFRTSAAGDLALTIGGLVQTSLAEVSAGAVQVQPMAQARDRAVDYIRLEAAAATEDGSISPDSVAFYTQDGTQLLLSTRLRPFLDEFALTVNVIDLRSGMTMQGNTSFHPRFTEPLRAQLGG